MHYVLEIIITYTLDVHIQE